MRPIYLIAVLIIFCFKTEGQWLGIEAARNIPSMRVEDEEAFSSASHNELGFEFSQLPNYPDEVYKARIENLNSDLKLEYNEHVLPFIQHYSIRRRDVTEGALSYSKLYFPLFERMLKEAGLPIWLKYLSVAESTLDPKAYSFAKAAGLWQFVSGTGQMYGLKENYFIDERYDPIKATAAAIAHMKDLYEVYGDWYLVFAAYNSGAGNVNRAIRKSGGKKDYWEIRRYLPSETRGYVPSFIAASYIMNYYPEHNLRPFTKVDLPNDLDTVEVTGPMAFDKICLELKMDEELLSILNPAFKRKHIPDNGEKYKLCVPSFMHDAFVSNKSGFKIEALENKYLEEEMFFEDKDLNKKIEIRYLVRETDILDSLARLFGCKSSDLMEWNGLTSDSLIFGKQLKILIPVKERLLVSERLKVHIQNMEKESGEYKWHTVTQGETLYAIYKKHQMFDVNRIRIENGLTDKDVITVDMELKVGKIE